MGRGTTFQILLPAIASFHSSNERTQTQPLRHCNFTTLRGNGKLLLVDDEDNVRKIGELVLSNMGFDVLTATDGNQAVELFSQHSTEIRGVLLDLTMPRMDGIQTFRALRQIKPDVRTVLISGYCEQELSERYAKDGFYGFIQKPYTIKDLSTVLFRMVTD